MSACCETRTRTARLLVSSAGDRLAVVGASLPDSAPIRIVGIALRDLIGGAPFAIPDEVMVTDAVQPEPEGRACAPRLALGLDPPLWREPLSPLMLQGLRENNGDVEN